METPPVLVNPESPPLRPKPMEEVMALLGYSAKYSTKKSVPCDSPLVPIPMTDVIRMIVESQLANKKAISKKQTVLSNKKINIKKVTNKDPRKTITFKIPKKILNRTSAVGTSRPSISYNIQPKPLSQVRKVLFSDERSPVVNTAISNVVKASKPKISLAIGSKIQILNTNTSAATDQTKGVDSSTKTIKSTFRGKQTLSDNKLSNSTDGEFELAEYLCNLPNSTNDALKIKNFHYLHELLKNQQELQKKQQALSIEINEVWQRIYSDIIACSDAKNTNVKSPLMKVSSAKKLNLLKATLLKTVHEFPADEAVSDQTSEPVVKKPDVKMTQSITMYNTMRSHFLETPIRSRRSLEHGADSISTTIQKQCLLLMDTPKA